MKCCFCNSESDIYMTDGRCVCLRCAEQKGLVTCTKKGKVIADPEFHCDNLCNDCIYKEEENRKIVDRAGITDPSKCTVKKIGDVTFYLQNRESSYLVGWESTRKLECLELPTCCQYLSEECIKNIVTLVYPKGTTYIDLTIQFTNFDNSAVKKIVIPKEANCIAAEDRLGNVEEIELEDPYGWGMQKCIRSDSKKTYEYICQYMMKNRGLPLIDGLPSLENPKLKKSLIKVILERIFNS